MLSTQLEVFEGVEVFKGPEMVGGGREWENREWFPPGPQLAICLSGGKEHLADLNDDELLQVAAAARRQTSWAQARELAAIAELTRRRDAAEEAGDPDYRTLSAHESVTEEVAAALTVTGNAAATLVHLAERLTGPLTATGDALEAGRIDMAKARVICDTTENLPDQVIRRVEAGALEKASTQTTGQLRRRIRRITHRLAPEAMEQRKREATRHRRLELWDTPSGTADLALCDLAAEDAHGIYNKITAAAHGLKADGDTRPLHLIRADLATNLLSGAPLPDAIATVLAQATHPGPAPFATHAPELQPDVRPHVPAPVSPAAATPPEPPLHTAAPAHPAAQGHPATEPPAAQSTAAAPAAVTAPAAAADQSTSAGSAMAAEQVPASTICRTARRVEAAASATHERSTHASDRGPLTGRLAAIPRPPDPTACVADPRTSEVEDSSAARGKPAPAHERFRASRRLAVVPASPAPTAAAGPDTGAVNGDGSAGHLPPATTTHPFTDARVRGSAAAHHLPEQAMRSIAVREHRALGSTADTATSHRALPGDARVASRMSPAVDAHLPTPVHDRGRIVAHHPSEQAVRSAAGLRAVECDEAGQPMSEARSAGSAAVVVPFGGTAGARARPEDDGSGLSVAGVVAMIERRLGHLRDRATGAELPGAVNLAVQQLTRRLAPQRDALCQGDAERHGRPGYRPPASLRREIEERHATCVFPTCNRASHRCDLDHTVPWRPGITCRCNLAPLCRRHHRLKQSPGWNLHHVWPGVLVWTTPAGTWYIVRPDRQ